MFATSFLPPPLLPFSTTSITTSFYHSPVCVTSPSQNPLVTILTFLNPFHHSDTDKALPPHVNRRTEDDGLKSRLAARRSRTSRRALAPTKRRARRVVRPLDVVSLRAFGLPETYIYQLLAAAGRRTRSTPVASALPYDLQRALFDELVPPRRTVPTSPPSPGWAAASWRFVADTARFLTVQGGGWAGKKRGVTAVDAVAMAHDTAAAEDWEGNSAAAAYAAAAAIANSSSDATLDDTELAGLTAGVAAARAVATVDDAAVFVDTVGVAPLVTAARLLPGTERAAALTALANIAIMLPEFRSHMLRVEKGCIVKTLADIVTRSGHFKVPTAVGGMSSTEALVSGTHLLGSLALAKGRLGAEWRNKMALDADLVRSLQRLAGGLKNGEPEGAARAARRALGTLGINHWRPRMPGQRGLRILCIDGGGTRAIMAFEMVCFSLTACKIVFRN